MQKRHGPEQQRWQLLIFFVFFLIMKYIFQDYLFGQFQILFQIKISFWERICTAMTEKEDTLFWERFWCAPVLIFVTTIGVPKINKSHNDGTAG